MTVKLIVLSSYFHWLYEVDLDLLLLLFTETLASTPYDSEKFPFLL